MSDSTEYDEVFVDDPGTDWEEHAIILRPVRMFMSGQRAKFEYGRFHPISSLTNDRDWQKNLYRALLKLTWLSPRLRHAVMADLGRPPQREKRDMEEARTAALQQLVKDRETEMRRKGERPRGGAYRAAVEDVARRADLTVEALEQRFKRLNKRLKKRG